LRAATDSKGGKTGRVVALWVENSNKGVRSYPNSI